MKDDNSRISIGKTEFNKAAMVKWYDPWQLFDTSFRVLVSSIFSTYADKRESFATTRTALSYDYSDKDGLWVDYIADTGDGWNPTYYSAYLLAQQELKVNGPVPDTGVTVPRGDLLIMGGDQVYPTSAREEYHNRLWGPFECAFPNTGDPMKRVSPAPHLFAIPGNHDWYDGLSNFLKFFCQKRNIGGWKTQQERSYFAIQLTSNCWLWGIDISLNSDIDKPQLDYFQEVGTKRMQEGDHVILCTAEPAWINCDKPDQKDRYEKLTFFIQSCLEKIKCTAVDANDDLPERTRKLNLALVLAGDLHHYARYTRLAEGKESIHYITAGGAGTFLHPTHNLSASVVWKNKQEGNTERFELKSAYPTQEASRRLAFLNLLFPFKNISYSVFISTLYLLIGWSLLSGSPWLFQEAARQDANFGSFSLGVLTALAASPMAFMLLALLVCSYLLFADHKASAFKGRVKAAGLLHGLCHAAVAVALVWQGGPLLGTINLSGVHLPSVLLETMRAITILMVLLLIGGLAGGFLTGLYLLLTNLLLGVHDNEAFSALRHQDHKSFLRMHITQTGITVYSIRVRRVPRTWKRKEGTTASPSLFEPAVPHASFDCTLVEQPIKIPLKTSRALVKKTQAPGPSDGL